MATLTYITNVSVDGYIEDADGRFDWSEPGDDVFSLLTDLVRPVETWLYGRRLYEVMAVWETDPSLAAASEPMAEFAAVWQRGDKVVHSTTLDDVVTARTRLARRFDPDAVRSMKAAATGELTVGGADLARQAFGAGLIDECHLIVHPAVLGRGTPAFPTDARIDLELLDERRFDRGIVHLRYRVRT